MTARKRHYISRKGKKRILILLAVFVLMIVFFEMRLKPVTEGIAEVQAQSLSTKLINQTVTDIIEEMNIECDDLEHITQTDGGVISAINTNTVNVNRLKSIISVRIQDNLSDIKNRRVNIPLGTLMGSRLFNGQGPDIPLYITLSGNLESDFESTFESGGLNQTLHKISVRISADITVIMPMSTTTTSVETSVLIGETVIVGLVPSGMIYNS